ncbi:mitosis protein DIM1 domain-containing protein [Trichoderma novae-zelandiae]
MRSVLAYVLALLGSSTTLEEPVGVPGLVFTDEYQNEVFNRSASFHPNFSLNTPAGVQANGELVVPDVDLFFGGTAGLGRPVFIQALAFDPSGGLRAQFLDRVIIVEGNIAMLLSANRITSNSSDAHIETALAETMIFDKEPLGAGQVAAPPLRDVVLNPIANKTSDFTFKIKEKAAQFATNFNSGNASASGLLATDDVAVVSDGRNSTGRASLVSLFTRYNTSVPDLLLHDEFVVAQGNWAAAEYIFQGTRNGTFTMINGTRIAPDRAQYRARGMRFMRFNEDGLVDLFWQVADNDAFVRPLSFPNLTQANAHAVTNTNIIHHEITKYTSISPWVPSFCRISTRAGMSTRPFYLVKEDRLVVIRFGRDHDRDCMLQDEVLYKIADRVKNFAVIYLCDIDQVPDFNAMYELYDPCSILFFFRNKHMMCDFGTGNNNKLNWVLEDKQELIDIIETIYRGAKKGRGLVVSPKDYSTRHRY